jgi:hypothetical protein
MLEITRSGSVAQAIGEARDVPARVIPYAAAAALTRVAVRGQKAVVAQMPRVFDRPTPYTLNSLYVQTARKDKLVAQVAVKTKAGNSAVASENFLYPEVFGGARKAKRFENAFRYAGILPRGASMVASQASGLLDAYGNLSGPRMVQLISYFGGFGEQGYRANMSAKGRQRLAKARRSEGGYKTINGVRYFAITPGMANFNRQGLAPGIYAARGIHGSNVRPVLLFTRQAPRYRPRLAFHDMVQQEVAAHFPEEFSGAAQAILNRRAAPGG